MGRGRQKAKQTKVARQLKYYTPPTDYKALERELGHSSVGTGVVDDPTYDEDPYADLVEWDDDDEDDTAAR